MKTNTLFQRVQRYYPVFLILLTICISACEKEFIHTASTNPNAQNCPLCDYADSISGDYRGHFIGSEPQYAYQDTITITLEHVFKNLGPQIDSNRMFFKLIRHYNNGTTATQNISLDNDMGVFYGNPLDNNHLYISGDSLHYYHNLSGKMIYIPFIFNGKKIP